MESREISTGFVLRPAEERDMDTIFNWRNDPWIVSLGISKKTVTREEHQKWFDRVFNSPDYLLYIIESEEGEGMGTLRFDRQEDQSVAHVTIYLLQQFVGKGIGIKVLDEGCAIALREWPKLQSIEAHISKDNEKSPKAFEKAGFTFLKEAIEDGNEVGVMEFRQNE